MQLRRVKRLFTHEATITGQRQVGTEDDGFGGTTPVYDVVSLTVDGRFESDGKMLARQFMGEVLTDGPLFVCFGDGLAEWDDSPVGYDPDGTNPWVIQQDDTLTLDGLGGEYEIREITPLYLDSATPDLVMVEPEKVD